MNYTATVYDGDKILETHYCESHLDARVTVQKLKHKYHNSEYRYEIEEVA